MTPIFEQWLATHVPEKKDRVLNRLRAVHDGKLYDTEFGKRMRGEGILAEQIDALFEVACRKHGLAAAGPDLSTAAFRRQGSSQGELAL